VISAVQTVEQYRLSITPPSMEYSTDTAMNMSGVSRADILELARRLQSLLLSQGFDVVIPYEYDPTSMDVYIGDYRNYGYYVEISVSGMPKSIVYVRGPVSRPCDTIPTLVGELHKLRIRNGLY
jgi:hypothetical protein